MFEEKAEEYRKDLKSKFFLSEPQLDLACQGFKDGYNKANEWHILAENQNDLPPKETTVKVLTQDGEICESKYYYDDYYEEYSWSNIGDSKVLAWKEIVLPKESE